MVAAIRIQHQEGEGEERRLKEAVVEERCHQSPSPLAAAGPIVGSTDSRQHNSGSLRMLRTGPSHRRSTAHIERRSPSWRLQEHFRLGHPGHPGSLTLKAETVDYAGYIRRNHRHVLLRRVLHRILHCSDDLLAGRSHHSHAEEDFL